MRTTLANWIRKQSKTSLTLTGFVLVLVVATIDSLTPPEMTFTVSYFFPVLFVTWFVGRKEGVMISFVSAISWLLVNLTQRPEGWVRFAPYWNATNGLVAFLAVVFFASAMKTLNAITEREVLERKILEATDEEQRRIGRDLHDGLCQHLSATMFACKIVEDQLAKKSLPEAVQVRQITDFIDRAIN